MWTVKSSKGGNILLAKSSFEECTKVDNLISTLVKSSSEMVNLNQSRWLLEIKSVSIM